MALRLTTICTPARINVSSHKISTYPVKPIFLHSRRSVRHFSIMSSVEERAQQEKAIGRNPHPDFEKVEGSRPEFAAGKGVEFTKTKKPEWKYGEGANDGGESLTKKHVEVDPNDPSRPPQLNYKLLISAITPRFIGFISTRSKDGKSTNLAPFSYTTVVNHDPPIYCIGFAGAMDKAKDSLKNLVDSGECVMNVISEHFIEAANACSINAPYGESEWAISGLTPADCSVVKAQRVKESVFSVEGKLVETKEFESRRTPGKKTSVLAIVEGVRFWIREDATNDERSLIDPDILKPVSRMGGITYARTQQMFELQRPDFAAAKSSGELDGLIENEK